MGIVQKECTQKQFKAAIEARLNLQGPVGQDNNSNNPMLMDSPFSLCSLLVRSGFYTHASAD